MDSNPIRPVARLWEGSGAKLDPVARRGMAGVWIAYSSIGISGATMTVPGSGGRSAFTLSRVMSFRSRQGTMPMGWLPILMRGYERVNAAAERSAA